MPKQQPGANIPPGKTFDGLSYLTCDSIGDLDHGIAREVIDEQLRIVMEDIEQRGDDDKCREVNIKIKLQKISQDEVRVEFEATNKVPVRTLCPTTAVMRRAAGEVGFSAAFRADNPTRPDQPTLPFNSEAGDAGEGEQA